MIAQLQSLQITGSPLSLTDLLLNLLVGAGIALGLRKHFEVFASTLGNKREFANNFTIILLTTTLVISIVKSSLALSLGLVGALSIVRFRTPIKEPEELAYLFLAIAAGLGLGADQTRATVIAVFGILLALTLIRLRAPKDQGRHLYLSVRWPVIGANHAVDQLSGVVGRHALRNDLRRLDVHDGGVDAMFLVDLASPARLSALVDDLRRSCTGVEISLMDHNRMPAV